MAARLSLVNAALLLILNWLTEQMKIRRFALAATLAPDNGFIAPDEAVDCRGYVHDPSLIMTCACTAPAARRRWTRSKGGPR
jgi:hypothetical protein